MIDKSIPRALCRATLRFVRDAFRVNPGFRIMSSLDPAQWGKGKMLEEGWLQEELQEFSDIPLNNIRTADFFTKEQLYRFIKDQYRVEYPEHQQQQAIERGFGMLQKLSEQATLNETSSCAVTNGVEVFATSYQLPGYVARKPYVFTYRIRLRNVGTETIQITHRHWELLDERGRKSTIVAKWGEALVGIKPTLKPGQCFEYYSGTDLASPKGMMAGTLLGKSVDTEEKFEIDVKPFALGGLAKNE